MRAVMVLGQACCHETGKHRAYTLQGYTDVEARSVDRNHCPALDVLPCSFQVLHFQLRRHPWNPFLLRSSLCFRAHWPTWTLLPPNPTIKAPHCACNFLIIHYPMAWPSILPDPVHHPFGFLSTMPAAVCRSNTLAGLLGYLISACL